MPHFSSSPAYAPTSYSPHDIQIILEASGVEKRRKIPYAQDISQSFNVSICFIEESIDFLTSTQHYLTKTKTQAKNRRVAYFLNETQVFIIEYSDFRPEKPPAESYGNIHLTMIGINETEEIVKTLGNLLKKSYPNANCTRQSIESEKTLNSIQITEIVRRILLLGELNNFTETTEEILKQHQTLCVNYLSYWLDNVKTSAPTSHQQLIATITILFKYAKLQHQREFWGPPEQLNAATLNDILKIDHQNKQLIFAEMIQSPLAYFNQVPLKSIIHLLTLRHGANAPSAILTELTLQHEIQSEKLMAWENIIQQRWKTHQKQWGNWFWTQANQNLTLAYHNSPIGIGSNLGNWLGHHAESCIDWESPWVRFSIKLIKMSVKLAVFFPTLSPHLANYAADSVEQLLSKKEFPGLMKTVGEDLGIVATLSINPLSLFNATNFLMLFMLPVVNTQLHHYLKQERIDMIRAQIISNENSIPSLATLLRINHLLIALISSFSQQNYRILITGLSGTASSVSMEKFADWIFDNLQEVVELKPEDRQYLHFLLSIIALKAGEECAQIYFHTTDKLEARRTTQAALESYNKRNAHSQLTPNTQYHAKFPDWRTMPSFWTDPTNNPFTLFAIKPNEILVSECQIILPTGTNHELQGGGIACHAPHKIV